MCRLNRVGVEDREEYEWVIGFNIRYFIFFLLCLNFGLSLFNGGLV